jgi:LysR family transcriptional activator of dmlA
VSGARGTPRGLLRVAATLGFGRRHLAPALSAFGKAFPEIELQLHLTDRALNLVEQGFDVGLRFGDLPDSRLTARRLLVNRRLLCASPGYLAEAGEPRSPSDLVAHRCIVIRESDETYGTWHLHQGERQETVKVRGRVSTNDGDSALAWALDGYGILLRSLWAAKPYLDDGRLHQVLPAWSLPAADVYLVFPTTSIRSAKTRALVDFLVDWFATAKGQRR